MELPYPLALQIVKHANRIVAIRGDLNVLVQLTLVHFFLHPTAPRSSEAIMPAVGGICGNLKQCTRENFLLGHGTRLDVCDVKIYLMLFRSS